jgi:hypothetical protein
MFSVWESFFSAALALSAASPIKQRLMDAFGKHLAGLSENELPREIREEFVSLGSSLSTIRPMRGETAVQATVRKMSDPQAALYAARIIGLLGQLARLQAQTRQPLLRAVNGED